MSSTVDIPVFNPPISTSNLVKPPRESVLRNLRRAYAGGNIVQELEQRLADFHKVAHCVTMCSGFWTIALTISEVALTDRTDILMPSLTYRRMADVVAWTRWRPRFCEVDPVTLAVCAETMRASFAPSVALLLAVHPIVGLCDVAGLESLSDELSVPLLFDSVEAAFETAPAGRIGGFGVAECFSLHASKLLNGMEGGYVTTNDAALGRRLAAMRDGVAESGMDVRLGAIHAAMALACLDGLHAQIDDNRERYVAYQRALQSTRGVRLLPYREDGPTSYKTIVIELTSEFRASRSHLLDRLNAAGALARPYYHPSLHSKEMAYQHVPAHLPMTEALAERFVLLPCGSQVTLSDIAKVAKILVDLAC